MRVIKFRAWKDGEMSNPFYFGQVASFPSGIVTSYFGDEIMQFTGLTDANGIEIYDGDVVNCELITNTGVIEKHKGVVFFDDFEWSLELGDDSWPVASWACVKSAKVMGNIHQNPELLESNNV